jgi:hypothetical protein
MAEVAVVVIRRLLDSGDTPEDALIAAAQVWEDATDRVAALHLSNTHADESPVVVYRSDPVRLRARLAGEA